MTTSLLHYLTSFVQVLDVVVRLVRFEVVLVLHEKPKSSCLHLGNAVLNIVDHLPALVLLSHLGAHFLYNLSEVHRIQVVFVRVNVIITNPRRRSHFPRRHRHRPSSSIPHISAPQTDSCGSSPCSFHSTLTPAARHPATFLRLWHHRHRPLLLLHHNPRRRSVAYYCPCVFCTRLFRYSRHSFFFLRTSAACSTSTVALNLLLAARSAAGHVVWSGDGVLPTSAASSRRPRWCACPTCSAGSSTRYYKWSRTKITSPRLRSVTISLLVVPVGLAHVPFVVVLAVLALPRLQQRDLQREVVAVAPHTQIGLEPLTRYSAEQRPRCARETR